MQRIGSGRQAALLGNVGARIGGLASAFVATLILARHGGAESVGVYALLHVLPGLAGTIVTAGLPVAVPYFLAGPDRDNRRLPLTIVAIAVGGGGVGSLLWLATAPAFGPHILGSLSTPLVAASGLAVLTRTLTTTAKACSQGTHDLAGASRVILTEELFFLPAYVALGGGTDGSIVFGLLAADLAAGSIAWGRLARRGFFAGASKPSIDAARSVAAYGVRAQVGGVISQLNLRLDFVLLSVLAGPAVLGVYAVASKFAELVRVVSMSLSYVMYPRFATSGRSTAPADAWRLLRRAGPSVAAAIVPLWLAAGLVIPFVYGPGFDGAVTPTRIILLGLALEGAAGVITGFLYGVGRPGLNSWAMGAGLVATLALDLLLIPSHGVVGAAVASAIAYLTTALALGFFFLRVRRSHADAETEPQVVLRSRQGDNAPSVTKPGLTSAVVLAASRVQPAADDGRHERGAAPLSGAAIQPTERTSR